MSRSGRLLQAALLLVGVGAGLAVVGYENLFTDSKIGPIFGADPASGTYIILNRFLLILGLIAFVVGAALLRASLRGLRREFPETVVERYRRRFGGKSSRRRNSGHDG